MLGNRRDLSEWNWAVGEEPQPGDYGKQPDGKWYCVTPSGRYGGLEKHQIVEHEDGSITVSPSILVSEPQVDDTPWHGYLEHGVWREV
jgi:hypothetical protein